MSDGDRAAPPSRTEWRRRSVGQVTQVLRRGTAPVYVDNSGTLAIGQRCITSSSFDARWARPHSGRAMSRVVVPQDGDVLINSTGTGTIGRSVRFFGDGDCYIIDSHVTLARPKQHDLHGVWLNELLRSPAGQRYLEAYCYAGSTSQVELSAAALAAMPLPLPPIHQQLRFAECMEALDAQIAGLGRIANKLQLCRLGYVNDALNNDVEKVVPLGFMAEVGAGVTLGSEPRGRGTVLRPYLRVANVQDGHLDLREVKAVRVRLAEVERWELREGDVLMNEGGDADKLGRGAVWDGQIEGCLHQNHVFRVRCDSSKLFHQYLSLVSGSEYGKRYFYAASKQTTNLATINSRQIKAFPVPYRSMGRQREIVDAVAAIVTQIDVIRGHQAKLRLIRRGLAADVLTGRVAFPQQSRP